MELKQAKKRAGKRFERLFRLGYEKQIRIAERKAYTEARKVYLSAFKEATEQFLTNQNYENLSLVDAVQFTNLFESIYVDVGLRFAKWWRRTFDLFATKNQNPDFDLWQMAFAQYGREQAGRLVVTVQETMRNQFISQISREFQDPNFMALGADEQAKILNSKNYWNRKSRWMALRVARTESNAAANLGIEKGSLSLFKADEMVKKWDTSGDERVRDTHRAVGSAKPIPMDGYFQVGSVRMLRPSDPQAIGDSKSVASEVINCRCRMITIPKPDVLDNYFEDVLQAQQRQNNPRAEGIFAFITSALIDSVGLGTD